MTVKIGLNKYLNSNYMGSYRVKDNGDLPTIMNTRNMYDNETYKKRMLESTEPLEYIMNSYKNKHTNNRMNLNGTIGGNNVSIIKGNIIDLESKLRGTDSKLQKHIVENELKGINLKLKHLKTVQLIDKPLMEIPIPNEPKKYTVPGVKFFD